MGEVTRAIGWPLRNDQIVLSVLGGRDREEVAEEHGLTHQQISNIVNDPRAQEIISAARARIKEVLLEDIEDQLDLSAQLSLKVIRRTLEADISPVHKAKSNQDRVALKLLAGRGFLRTESRDGEQGLQMSADQHKRLLEGMEKAMRVRAIDPFEDKEIVVEDAEIVASD